MSAALLPFLRARGVAAPVVADPTGEVQRTYALMQPGGVALLDDQGGIALRTTTEALDVAAVASLARVDVAAMATR